MECKICGHAAKWIFDGRVLNNYDARYFACQNCGLAWVDSPVWLDEAYCEAINLTDSGILARNVSLSKLTAVILFYLFDKRAAYLDYAGGYGIFTRLMRDTGFDYYWSDPYSQNVFAKGFEYQGASDIQLITSFECFEHFIDPVQELNKMLSISKNILFTTELLPNPIPRPDEWWYYGLEHGQHISFYTIKSLNLLAEKHGLRFYSNKRNLHLFTNKNINGSFFNLLLKHHTNYLLCKIIRKRMRSKTFDDMKYLQSTLLSDQLSTKLQTPKNQS